MVKTEKDKIIEAKLKRIAKQIDPDNTFLNECEDVIKNRFSKTEKDKIKEEDIEYLEKEFPKGKTRFRGQAMVLLTLAREQGEQSQKQNEIKFLKDLYNHNWTWEQIHKEIKIRLGEIENE